MAKCTVEFDYSIGDLVERIGVELKLQVIGLLLDQLGKKYVKCTDDDYALEMWLPAEVVKPWPEQQGG